MLHENCLYTGFEVNDEIEVDKLTYDRNRMLAVNSIPCELLNSIFYARLPFWGKCAFSKPFFPK